MKAKLWMGKLPEPNVARDPGGTRLSPLRQGFALQHQSIYRDGIAPEHEARVQRFVPHTQRREGRRAIGDGYRTGKLRPVPSPTDADGGVETAAHAPDRPVQRFDEGQVRPVGNRADGQRPGELAPLSRVSKREVDREVHLHVDHRLTQAAQGKRPLQPALGIVEGSVDLRCLEIAEGAVQERQRAAHDRRTGGPAQLERTRHRAIHILRLALQGGEKVLDRECLERPVELPLPGQRDGAGELYLRTRRHPTRRRAPASATSSSRQPAHPVVRRASAARCVRSRTAPSPLRNHAPRVRRSPPGRRSRAFPR